MNDKQAKQESLGFLKKEYTFPGMTLFSLFIAYGLLGMALGMIAVLMPGSTLDWASAVLTSVAGVVVGYLTMLRLATDKAKRERDDTIKKLRQDTDAVSPVIAVVLMVAITVVLAATVFVLVSDIGNPNPGSPSINFDKDSAGGNLTVISVSHTGLEWTAFDVQGCTGVPGDTVTSGDVITGCAGDVFVRHIESESLVYQTSFA